jgi:hypothetical protein
MPLSFSGLCLRQPLVARHPRRNPSPRTADIEIDPRHQPNLPERAGAKPQRSINTETENVGTSPRCVSRNSFYFSHFSDKYVTWTS